MHKLKVVEVHILHGGVIKKGMCCYQLMLRLQKGNDIDQS